MKRLAQLAAILCGLAFALYLGSFAVLVVQGLEYGRQQGLSKAYFLADPSLDPGYELHYQRGRFYFPLVYFFQHVTHGPYFVYAH